MNGNVSTLVYLHKTGLEQCLEIPNISHRFQNSFIKHDHSFVIASPGKAKGALHHLNMSKTN